MNSYLNGVIEAGKRFLAIFHDEDKYLIPPWMIVRDHKRSIQAKIDKEAKNKLPNVVLLIKLGKELEECDKIDDLACYELALLNMFQKGIKNKHIMDKLEDKINQLRASRDYEFNQP